MTLTWPNLWLAIIRVGLRIGLHLGLADGTRPMSGPPIGVTAIVLEDGFTAIVLEDGVTAIVLE